MTVSELISELQTMPQDATVFAEGEEADAVILENCYGNEYVRIFKRWNVDFVQTRQQAISVLEMVEAYGLADEAKNIAINALKVFCDDNCEVCEFEKCPLTEGVAK